MAVEGSGSAGDAMPRASWLTWSRLAGSEWTGRHVRLARNAGWSIRAEFDNGVLVFARIVRDVNFFPGTDKFATDDDAFVHVATRAAAGDDLCRRAIEIVTPYLKG
jgi:hypothetical protein